MGNTDQVSSCDSLDMINPTHQKNKKLNKMIEIANQMSSNNKIKHHKERY